MNWKRPLALSTAALTLGTALAACGNPTAAAPDPTPTPAAEVQSLSTTGSTVKAPKYVFLFIGDGMSYPQIQSTSDFLGALNDADYRQAQPSLDDNGGAILDGPEYLNFMNFEAAGSAVTYDSNSFAPDSASTATSISTGYKTYSGSINVDETGTISYETIAEQLHAQKGYSVGVITSVNLNHATPAAFYAHQASRNDYYDIGLELIDSGFEYFAGGGLLKPIPGGTYAVSDALLADLKAGVQGQHASNLGGILAREIGDSLGVPSYIVDPVVVDELTDKARISGMPELPRRSIFHALNQKAVARRFAKENGKRYEDLNLIVIHMGGGVSVGAHDHGKVVDVNNILDGEGCFSPERSGTVPVGDLVKMCFSGKYTQKEVYKKICGNGGFNGYLHTNDAREVGKMAESGNALAKQVWEAFFYQIAKDAGAMAAVLHGKVDQIILTGGIAYNPFTAKTLTEYLGWIAPVTTYPGEDELLALCQGALRVMTGEEEAKNY